MSDAFQTAADRVKTLKTAPSNADLLKLYGLYKQGSSGDVTGSRPGMMAMRDRAKFDAWAALKGTSKDDAQAKYVALVDGLIAKG